MDGLPTVLTPDMEMLRNNKDDAYNYRFRRHEDWLDNYTLARDRIIINRLEQRQTVNLPLMKTAIKTLLKDVDDMPVLYFENLDNDKQAEVFKNEYWKYVAEKNKMELLDIVDKKQVFYFGRSFDQWQIIDGLPRMTIIDPMDMLIPRYNDPTNIHKCRFVSQTHVFVPLAVLEQNKDYNPQAIQDLKTWYATEYGLVKQAENQQMLAEKNKRMSEMGLMDVDQPILGETWVELSLNFCWYKEKGDHYEQIYLFVDAENMLMLMKKPLEKIIGPTSDNWWRYHFPYNTWSDDVENQDFWSDSVADTIRGSNKIANAWWSQLVENRTLRNFNMHYYNSSMEGFAPQTYDPRPWGWYPIPVGPNANIQDVLQTVEIPQLEESIPTLDFLMGIIDRASGATSTQQGVQNEKQITLGEVQLALSEAKERVKGMAKFYTQAWKDRGEMFYKLLEAAPEKLDAVRIYKKGRNTDRIYSREVSPTDWEAKLGYRCRVWSQEEKNEMDTQQLTKLNAVKANMPDNPVVDEEYKRKLLEFAGFEPDKLNEAMKYEDEKRAAMMQNTMMPGQPGMGGPMGQPGLPGGQPPAPALPQGPQALPAKAGQSVAQ